MIVNICVNVFIFLSCYDAIFNLPIDPYIPLRLLCSRSPTTYTGQWITAPSLFWSASIFPLHLTLWTTVFCPVVCSLISALMELNWTGFSHILVADSHALRVSHRAACLGLYSLWPTSRWLAAWLVDLASSTMNTLMIRSYTSRWLTEALWTGCRAASAVSSTGSCAITCYSMEASQTPSSLGQLNVTLGRCSRHICVSLRVVLQSVTAWSFLAWR